MVANVPSDPDLAGELDRVTATQGAPSARSLLLTVLGTFVLPAGGSAWTSSLVAALGLVGVEDRTARQALARAGRSGWLVGTRHGRRARWELTPRADRILTSGADRIYSFGRTPVTWDGRWLLLFASVPESRRDARYRLRSALNWAGFGSLGPGVWLSPDVAREADAIRALDELDETIAARTFVAHHGRIGDRDTIVSEAWDLDSLRSDYEHFLESSRAVGIDVDRADAARELVIATHRWRQFPAVDPALPNELLPPDWPGRRAAERFASLRADLVGPARRWWADLEAAAG